MLARRTGLGTCGFVPPGPHNAFSGSWGVFGVSGLLNDAQIDAQHGGNSRNRRVRPKYHMASAGSGNRDSQFATRFRPVELLRHNWVLSLRFLGFDLRVRGPTVALKGWPIQLGKIHAEFIGEQGCAQPGLANHSRPRPRARISAPKLAQRCRSMGLWSGSIIRRRCVRPVGARETLCFAQKGEGLPQDG